VSEPGVVLFDIGGVLLTNGWDVADRAEGARRFHLDLEAFEARHATAMPAFERGELSLEGYLEATLPAASPRKLRDELRAFILGCSRPHPDTLRVVDRVRGAASVRLVAFNNEGRELNEHRIATFHLDRLFSLFFSSCYTGRRKPDPAAYRGVVDVLRADPRDCLFVDDREENLVPARSLGMGTIQYRSPEQLATALALAGVRS